MHINFNITKTPGLREVEEVSLQEIISVAKVRANPTIKNKYKIGSVNVSMFISRPGDVIVPHSLADRNYLLKKTKGLDEYSLSSFRHALVPGQWARRRILQNNVLGFSRRNVIAAGSPRIDWLRRQQTEHISSQSSTGVRVLCVSAGLGTDAMELMSECGAALQDACTITYFNSTNILEGDSENLRNFLDCDVVITDYHSVSFDAWALGKPVIFPSWAAEPAVKKRFPGSAEAYIYSAHIGYHASSVEELKEIILSDPKIGQDVDDFMLDYLENYRGGSSAERIVDHLLRISSATSDTDRQTLHIDAVTASLPATQRIPSAQEKPRASIQMLQLAALEGSYGTASEALTLMQGQGVVKPMADLLFGMQIDLLLMQGMFKQVERLVDSIQNDHPSSAAYGKLRLARQEGDSYTALSACQAYFASGGRSIAVWRILAEQLCEVGEPEAAMDLLLGLNQEMNLPELFLAAADTIDTADSLNDFLSSIGPFSTQLRKSFGAPTFNAGLLRAYMRASRFDKAVPVAVELASLVIGGDWRWPAKRPVTGWLESSSLPCWLSPLEFLRLGSLSQSPKRAKAAFEGLAKLAVQYDLPLFLSGGSLRDFLKQQDDRGYPAKLEFGVKSSAGVEDVVALVRGSGLFRVRPTTPEALAEGFTLKHVNGYGIFLRLYIDDRSGKLTVRSHGITSVISDFALEHHDVNGQRVLVPQAPDRYFDEIFGGAFDGHGRGDLFYGRDVIAENTNEFIVALCNEVVEGTELNQTSRVSAALAMLIERGYPTPWLQAAGMGDKYIAQDPLQVLRTTRFAIHIGEGLDGAYYIDLWYCFFKNVDENTIVIIRNKLLFDLVKANNKEINAFYIKTALEMEWLFDNTPNLSAVFYPANSGNNIHSLRFNELRHIFIGHGDSEKIASCHKFFRAYDEVWTAGRAHIDRFRNSGFDHSSLKFKIVGRPTLRNSIRASSADGPNSFLYLPTWEGYLVQQAYSSVEFCERFLSRLAEILNYDAIVKFHPWVGKNTPGLRDIESRLRKQADKPTISVVDRSHLAADLMKNAKFLIADISSVISDYVVTGRPIFLFIPENAQLVTSTSSMPMERYCYVYHKVEQLIALVQRVIIDGDDYLRDIRLKAREYFVDIERTLNFAFEDAMRGVTAEHEATKPQVIAGQPQGRSETRPRIIGHRGAKALWPENSLSGFKNVVKLPKLDGVEFDVHLTADGEIVVLHDPLLDRTTTGTGPVGMRTLSEIRVLRLSQSAAASETKILSEGVPTLEEVLDVLAPSKLELHIELKNDALGRPYAGLVEKVLEQIRLRNLGSRVTLTSFQPSVLEHVNQIDPKISLLGSVNYRSMEMLGGPDQCLARFKQIPGCMIALEHQLASSLQWLSADGFDIGRYGLWVLNEPAAIARAIAAGVPQITTDRPDVALKQMKEITNND